MDMQKNDQDYFNFPCGTIWPRQSEIIKKCVLTQSINLEFV